jgi:hypothetical protein
MSEAAVTVFVVDDTGPLRASLAAEPTALGRAAGAQRRRASTLADIDTWLGRAGRRPCFKAPTDP